MKINGATFTSDLIVFADHVKSDWWRIEGHKLHVEDLDEALIAKPRILIVGTSHYELVRILPETQESLQTEGVRLIAGKTGKAYKMFN